MCSHDLVRRWPTWNSMRRLWPIVLVLACGEETRSAGLFGTGDGGGVSQTESGAMEGGDASGGTSADESSAGGEEEETGIKLDVGNMSGGSAGDEAGCVTDCGCSAVDLLFVIDNSTSMND